MWIAQPGEIDNSSRAFTWNVPRDQELEDLDHHNYRFYIYDAQGEDIPITAGNFRFKNPTGTYNGQTGDLYKGADVTMEWVFADNNNTPWFVQPAIKLQKENQNNNLWEDVLEIASPGQIDNSSRAFTWNVPTNQGLQNLSSGNYRLNIYDGGGEHIPISPSNFQFTGSEAPITNNITVSAAQATAINITLDGTDIDGDNLTYTITSSSNGTTVLNGAVVTYTSNQGFSGIDSFTYNANDGTHTSNTATVNVAINNPASNNVTASTNEDTAVDITLDGSDGNGDSLTYSVVSNPSNGSVVIGSDTATYTPTANWSGTDTFTYKANDGALDSNTATVTVTVNSIEDVPQVNNVTASTDEDVVIDITLDGSDGDSDALTYSIVTDASNGSTSLSGNTVTYTPSANWNGIDAFTYKANDSKTDSNTGTVTITVGEVGETVVYMHNGSTNGDGTESNPFNNFNSAASEIETDPSTGYATIILLPGTYDQLHGELIGDNPHNVHVKSQSNDPSDTIVDGKWYFVVPNPYNLKIEGMTLQNSNDGAIYTAISAAADSLVIRNMIIKDNDAPTNSASGWSVIQNSTGSILIEDSVFENNNMTSYNVEAIRSLGGDTEVINSTFKSNIQNGGNGGNLFEGGIIVKNSNFISQSDIVSSGLEASNSIFLNTGYFTGGGNFTNCIIMNATVGGSYGLGGTIKNSIIYNSNFNSYSNGGRYWNDYYNIKVGSGGTFQSIGGVVLNNVEDIMFIDYAANKDFQFLDFHLQHQSPAIDIGDPSSDYSNEPGPNGDRVNAGIYGNTFEAQVTNTAPVVEDISTTTNETREALMQLQITLLGSDIDGDNLTYTVNTPNNGGTITSNGSLVTYTPQQDFHGIETFTYTANDGQLTSNTATLSITVVSVDDVPIANNMNFTENEDTPSTNTLTVTNVDEDVLIYSLVTQPSNGEASVGANSDNTAGWVTYTPNLNWNGQDIFSYKVEDSNGNESAATITFNINAVDDPTIANDMTTYTPENTEKAIVLSVTEVDGDNLTFSIDDGGSPDNGSVNISNNIATYTPNTDWAGTDTFVWKAYDGTDFSNAGTVTIIVNNTGAVPTANDLTTSTNEDTDKSITLDANDPDGDSLTYSIVDEPENGSVVFASSSPSEKVVVYTPNTNYHGQDTFTYKANDGTEDSNTARVIITINSLNDAPTTNDVATTIDENRVASRLIGITLDGSDVDGDNLSYILVSNPSNGTASLSGSTVTYTANQDWNGVETFTYKANDALLDSNISTITVTVNAVNDTPVVTGTGGSGVTDTKAIRFGNNDSAGSYLEIPSNGYGTQSTFTTTAWIKVIDQPLQQPSGGTIIARRNYTGQEKTHFHFYVGKNLNLSFLTNDRNVNSFAVNTAVNTITLNQWHHVAYTFDNGASNFYIDGQLTNHTTSGSSGDTSQLFLQDHWLNIGGVHRTSGTKLFDFFSGEMNELAIWGDALTANDIQILFNDGNYYDADDLGKDIDGWWQFESSDLVDASGNWANATSGGNGGSIAIIDSHLAGSSTIVNTVITDEDIPIDIDLSSYVTDIDGDNLIYSVITDDMVYGTVSLNGSKVTYTPNSNVYDTDSFTWKVNDGIVESDISKIIITINPVNDPHFVADINKSTDEDVPLDIVLSSVDIDGGTPQVWSVVTNPGFGTATITDNSNGILRYTPNSNWHGTDTFTFKINDGDDSNIATATITVNPVGDDLAVKYISIQNTQYKNVDWVRMVQETSDGGFIILHPAKKIDNDSIQYPALTKTDSEGNVIWERVLEFIGQSATGGSVRETNDGGFIVAGFTTDSTPQGLLIKTDSNGNSEWTQEYGNPNGRDMLYSVYVLEDGYVANGETNSFSSGSNQIQDIFTIRVDNSGNSLWQKGFGNGTFENGEDNTLEYSFGANAVYSDGSYIFSAGTRLDQANSVYRGVFYRYDMNGTLLNSVSNNTHSDVYSIHPGNGYIMTGGLASGQSAWPSGTGVIHSFKDPANNSNLTVTNYHTAYSSINDTDGYIHSSPTSDGGAIIVGESLNSDGEPQIALVKIDASGNEEWTGNFSSDDSANEVGPVEADYGRFAVETSDGNYVVVGHSYHPKSDDGSYIYYWKTLFVKFDSSGQVVLDRNN